MGEKQIQVNSRFEEIMIPASSKEIISSGVTPTCRPKRTSFSAVRCKRIASFSIKSSRFCGSDSGACDRVMEPTPVL
jgi:hypothetical protein